MFLSADSFSSTLLVVSSKEGEEELFDKFFVAFIFQLKPGILALNQVVSLEASTWTQNWAGAKFWGWTLGMKSGDELLWVGCNISIRAQGLKFL